MKVGDIMTRRVMTAGPDTGVDAIARMMLEHRIGAVPIVHTDGRLVGILTDHDLMGHPPQRQSTRLVAASV